MINRDWFMQEQPMDDKDVGPKAARWGVPAVLIFTIGFWSAVVAIMRTVEF